MSKTTIYDSTLSTPVEVCRQRVHGAVTYMRELAADPKLRERGAVKVRTRTYDMGDQYPVVKYSVTCNGVVAQGTLRADSHRYVPTAAVIRKALCAQLGV